MRAKERRPSYERMLGDIAAGQRDAVIVDNTDRLTRCPIELEQFTGICEVAGVRQLVTVTGESTLATMTAYSWCGCLPLLPRKSRAGNRSG